MTSLRTAPAVLPQDLWSDGLRDVQLSGTQAVIRFLLEALRNDREQGYKTAAFVSGYQGSPLGGFDLELERAMRAIDVEIVHQPGINEELGATAVMGSQVASLQPTSTHDGVIGVWYGKTPGLDRAADALRHASYAGASAKGGLLILVGDDPMAKSSTLPSASEGLLAELWIPVLFPRNLTEVIELGHHAIEMSRLSGAPVALKLVSVIADAEGTATIGRAFDPVLPEGLVNPGVSSDLLTPATLVREPVVATERLEAAARYGDANKLNRVAIRPERPRVGLAAAGTVFSELKEALLLLGLDEAAMLRQGVELIELSMPFPLGPGIAEELRTAGDDLVVIEERRELIEHQVLSMLGRSGAGPRIWGKRSPTGEPFIPRSGTLTPDLLARVLHPMLAERLDGPISVPPREKIPLIVAASSPRTPWYCSGCPHSASTAVPDGLPVGIGIGCHSITTYMPEERVGRSIGITQMGGEGAQWVGMSRFVDDDHIFQNMGDSTFFHSGHLAIRSAIASGVSITYKILWNGVSAMTGGQHPAGGTSLASAVRMLQIEGAAKVVVTTDDVKRTSSLGLPREIEIHPREELLEVQRQLALIPGVTVLFHDQACATELRRARKRAMAPKPTQKVVINERVCEGCGDCQVKSNCLSLETVSTTYGPKTRINEETCNLDLSCLSGDCPAFTLVEISAEQPARREPVALAAAGDLALIPEPPTRGLERSTTVRLAGIGGTGVVTAAHLLARAALLDGVEAWGVDQTGMSQKAGTVVSDLRIGPGSVERSNVLGADEVDVLIACDLLSATSPGVLDGLSPSRSQVVGSTTPTLTGPMILGLKERSIDEEALAEALRRQSIPGSSAFVEAELVLEAAGISAAASNVLLIGIALQRGLLPLQASSLRRAIEENGVAVEQNLSAFELGRAWAVGLAGGSDSVSPDAADRSHPSLAERYELPDALREELGILADELVAYQGAALAETLLGRSAAAWKVEEPLGGTGELCRATADGLFKLMAYKDEYEVARLLLDHPAAAGRTTWLLHPPALRARGLKRKLRLGPRSAPLLKALRAGRHLRGTRLDPFGRSPLRRQERQLVAEQLDLVDRVLPVIEPSTLGAAAELLRLPLEIRGYESVKERSLEEFRSHRAELLERILAQPPERAGAGSVAGPER